MKNRLLTFAVFALAVANPAARAQQSSVHVVVTVKARKGQETPVINREDVVVHEGDDQDEVIDWFPARGERASLELMTLLDDGSNTTLGAQLERHPATLLTHNPTPRWLVSLIYMTALLNGYSLRRRSCLSGKIQSE